MCVKAIRDRHACVRHGFIQTDFARLRSRILSTRTEQTPHLSNLGQAQKKRGLRNLNLFGLLGWQAGVGRLAHATLKLQRKQSIVDLQEGSGGLDRHGLAVTSQARVGGVWARNLLYTYIYSAYLRQMLFCMPL